MSIVSLFMGFLFYILARSQSDIQEFVITKPPLYQNRESI